MGFILEPSAPPYVAVVVDKIDTGEQRAYMDLHESTIERIAAAVAKAKVAQEVQEQELERLRKIEERAIWWSSHAGGYVRGAATAILTGHYPKGMINQ